MCCFVEVPPIDLLHVHGADPPHVRIVSRGASGSGQDPEVGWACRQDRLLFSLPKTTKHLPYLVSALMTHFELEGRRAQ